MSDPSAPNHDDEVDASGLLCPLPLLKGKRALNRLAAGQVLRVIATDPGAPQDFRDFADMSGHELLATQSDGERHLIWLRKSG